MFNATNEPVNAQAAPAKTLRSSIASGYWIVLTLVCVVLGLSCSVFAGRALAQQMPTPNEIRQSRPDEPGSAVTQAMRLLGLGQHADALAALDVALKATPRDPRVRFTYGLVLADQGKASEAIDVLTQLTQDFPELPEPFNNLAALHASRGELDKARLALENALRALPTYSLAHENLGDVHLRLAARAYEQAGASDRANTAAQNKLTMTRELLSRVAPKSSAK